MGCWVRCTFIQRIRKRPITNAFAMELLVFFAMLAYFVVVRVTLSVERPGPVQHVAEFTHEFVSDAEREHHRPRL